MLTEFVSAVVSVIVAELLVGEVLTAACPEIVIGDLPLTVESGVNLPLSSAAAAVTTFIVEPGG